MSDAAPQPAREHLALAAEVARRYAAHPQVAAVALSGSQSAGTAGPGSDLDLYVYLSAPLPIAARRAIATARASRAEVDNQFWEPGDEWVDADSGVGVDVMFRDMAWIEGQIERVLARHQASVGYSTAFWHNLLTSIILFDRDGWLQGLQERARQPYPAELRRAIVAKNHPLLRQTLSSYAHQIARALERRDLVSLNHRLAALLASYFDILFAINRLPHPGEKRQVQHALARCALLPAQMPAQIETCLISAAGGDPRLLAQIDALIDGLDAIVAQAGL